MYYPIDIMSLFFPLEMERKQGNKGFFVSPTMLYSVKSVYNIKE